MKRFVATLALCTGIATVSFGTVLNFDNLGLSNNSLIPTDYGSRVTSSGNDAGGRTGFDLTHGATPNVAVQICTADIRDDWNCIDGMLLWNINTLYSGMYSVAYTYENGRIIFTADAGHQVRLHSFQMGAWQQDLNLLFLQVLVDGNPVYTRWEVPLSARYPNNFTFDPNVVKGSVIEIRWVERPAYGNVCIDNIAFSQTTGGGCDPDPADVDGDGDVDDADLLQVLFRFGWSCGG